MVKPIVVAELSINHLGMVNIAKKMIDSAKDSGANLVKLKLKNVGKYYKDDGKKWRNFNFKEYRNSLELSKENILEISEYCRQMKIDWFCTVHDQESLEYIESLNPAMYKVASMDSSNENLVDLTISSCKRTGKPLVISLGGKDNKFTEDLVSKINQEEIESYILHTVSIYPTPIGMSNINYLKYLRSFKSDKIKIGYSGHEIGFSATLLAAMLGIDIIERHLSLTKDVNIHHIRTALIPSEFKQMVQLLSEITAEVDIETVEFYVDENKFLEGKFYE